MCMYPFTHPSTTHLYRYLSTHHPSVHVHKHTYMYPSMYLSTTHLSIHYLSTYPSSIPFMHTCVYSSTQLSTTNLSFYKYTHHPSIHLCCHHSPIYYPPILPLATHHSFIHPLMHTHMHSSTHPSTVHLSFYCLPSIHHLSYKCLLGVPITNQLLCLETRRDRKT